MSKHTATIPLGFELGTGEPVTPPVAHTFVTGQTQLSGKTTTLRAMVERSGRRALAFVTKRGESFEGRRIPPYLPREGDRPISWRLVETLLASALGQRSMKYERFWIVNAAKGATSLSDVRRNVARLGQKAKGSSGDMYMLLGEYLDLILPEMKELDATDELDLQPGLNVMDLGGVGLQLQSLVIRAALEHVNLHETGVLTVFPEAWEFAPRGRSAPAKDEAIAMARKGAVLGNFLLCDSQDIAGVDTVVRQAASVWILGVQRELNELKRTIQMIPAGIKRPKPEDVATLGLGQFFVCWGSHAVKTYVQPAWMGEADARAVAMGELAAGNAARHEPLEMIINTRDERGRKQKLDRKTAGALAALGRAALASAQNAPAATAVAEPQTEEDDMSKEDVDRLEKSIEQMGDKLVKVVQMAIGAPPHAQSYAPRVSSNGEGGGAAVLDEDALYERFKERLLEDPRLIKLATTKPAIDVEVETPTLTMEGDSLKGRVAKLIAQGFIDSPLSHSAILKELQRTGPSVNGGNLSKALTDFVKMGFLTDEADGYKAVKGMKVNIVKK